MSKSTWERENRNRGQWRADSTVSCPQVGHYLFLRTWLLLAPSVRSRDLLVLLTRVGAVFDAIHVLVTVLMGVLVATAISPAFAVPVLPIGSPLGFLFRQPSPVYLRHLDPRPLDSLTGAAGEPLRHKELRAVCEVVVGKGRLGTEDLAAEQQEGIGRIYAGPRGEFVHERGNGRAGAGRDGQLPGKEQATVSFAVRFPSRKTRKLTVWSATRTKTWKAAGLVESDHDECEDGERERERLVGIVSLSGEGLQAVKRES